MKILLIILVLLFSNSIVAQEYNLNFENRIGSRIAKKDRKEYPPSLGIEIDFEIKPENPAYDEEFEISFTFVAPKDIDRISIEIGCPTKHIHFINEITPRSPSILKIETLSLKKGEKYKKNVLAKLVKKLTEGDIFARRFSRDVIDININSIIKNKRYGEYKRLLLFRKNIFNLNFQEFRKEYMEKIREKERKQRNDDYYKNGEMKTDTTKALPLENNNINDSKKAYHLWGYCKVRDFPGNLIPFKKGAVILYDAQDDSYIRHVYTDDNGYYYIETSNNSSDYVQAKISNGIFEGINSKIQLAKSRARGYRNTQNLINMVYFIADKLKFDYPRYST